MKCGHQKAGQVAGRHWNKHKPAATRGGNKGGEHPRAAHKRARRAAKAALRGDL